ncbi:family 16 glycoside hydrolase [Pontibacter pamirensis]|uniref:family 16 glycoside hydrolase n=1 Tax=Pontibacter pamirensis TaxID=2562824 RepID=UPI00138A5D16|nr:family 16 glycoside hydrolase [Pontibacter pamirensis]
MYKAPKISIKRLVAACAFIVCAATTQEASSQPNRLELKDLSAFQNPGKSWQVVGDVTAILDKENKLNTSTGTGVLVNLPRRKGAGKDLLTTFEHGDVDVELDYMMAKGSNSGIYLQGRYELQLEDSWGKTSRSASNNGGIYERWDTSRPKGQEGYQGYAPRQNVGRAPGLWQHLKISFQAPRFDANGNKIENAKMLLVELNGVPIHENVELFGPTRGAISNEEVASGPLRIQGDHGAVAFKNMVVTHFVKPRLELTDLKYAIYPGRHEKEPFYKDIPPEAEGPSGILTSNLNTEARQFLLRYTGSIIVKEPGEYTFDLTTPGGAGLVRINNEEVVPMKYWNGTGSVKLPAGKMPIEVVYSKYLDWAQPEMALYVSGPDLRKFLISDKEVGLESLVDPILVDPQEKPILRSFIDIQGGHRVTHAVSVGSPEELHYTYDMDHGSLVQLWRGGFLDATPMWHDRGDGSSLAIGSIQHFGKPTLSIAKLASEQAAWATDTTGSAYRQRGYRLNEKEEPTFMYSVYGANVEDAISVLQNGKGIQRHISLQNPTNNLYVRLVEGEKIEEVAKGMYLVDGKSYYVRLDDAGGAKPVVRNMAGRQELIIPVREKLTYSVLF